MRKTREDFGTQLTIKTIKGISTQIGFCYPKITNSGLKLLEGCSTVIVVPYLLDKDNKLVTEETIAKTKKALENQASKVIVLDETRNSDPNAPDYPGNADKVRVLNLTKEGKFDLARKMSNFKADPNAINIAVVGQNISAVHALFVELHSADILSKFDFVIGHSLGKENKVVQVDDYKIYPACYEVPRVYLSRGPRVTEINGFNTELLPLSKKGYRLVKVSEFPCKVDIAVHGKRRGRPPKTETKKKDV